MHCCNKGTFESCTCFVLLSKLEPALRRTCLGCGQRIAWEDGEGACGCALDKPPSTTMVVRVEWIDCSASMEMRVFGDAAEQLMHCTAKEYEVMGDSGGAELCDMLLWRRFKGAFLHTPVGVWVSEMVATLMDTRGWMDG